MYTIEQVKQAVLSKGHAWFEQGDWNINLVAVRTSDTFTNKFTDRLFAIYKENGVWQKFEIEWTTKAGLFGKGGALTPYTGRETGTGVDGVATLVEGQYKGAYQLTLNGTRYPFTRYLKQVKPMRYYRDNTKDTVLNRGTIYEGNYATHLHSMSSKGVFGTFVSFKGYSPWSAGCNGSSNPYFESLLTILIRASKSWGPIFTYTLINQKDFV